MSMNEPGDQIQSVNNPQQAIQQLVGEQFIEWLMDQIALDLATWPALRVLRDSQARPEKLRRFLLQRELARQAFWGGRDSEPGFLGFAAANLSESDDPDAEAALEIIEAKLAEHQRAGQVSDLDEILKFLAPAGDETAKSKPKEAVRHYIAEVSELISASDWQTGLGAIAADEWSWAYEYSALKKLIAGLPGGSGLHLPNGWENSKAMLEVGRLLDRVVFDETGKQLVWDGITGALAAKRQLLDDLIKYLQ
jgi:hypothetical protein